MEVIWCVPSSGDKGYPVEVIWCAPSAEIKDGVVEPKRHTGTNHLYSSLVEADLATGVSGGVFCFYCMLFRYGRVLTNTVETNVKREHAKEYLY